MFEVIPPKHPHGKKLPATDKVMVSTRPVPGRAIGRMLELIVGRQAAMAAGWRKDLKVTISWGTGADLGKLRVAPHEAGPFWTVRVNKKETVYKVTTAAIPEDLACRGERQASHHEILPKMGRDPGPILIVRLPKSVWQKDDHPDSLDEDFPEAAE